jgi:hypothetical protein
MVAGRALARVLAIAGGLVLMTMAAGCYWKGGFWTPLTAENVVGAWYVKYPEDGSEETVLLRPGGVLEQTCTLKGVILYQNEGAWEITDEGRLVFRHYIARWARRGVEPWLLDDFPVYWEGDGLNIVTDIYPYHNLQKIKTYGQSAKP